MNVGTVAKYALGLGLLAGAGWWGWESKRSADREAERAWRASAAEADFRLTTDLKALEAKLGKDPSAEARRAPLLRLLEKHPGSDRLEGIIASTYFNAEPPELEEALKWYLKVDYPGLSKAPGWNSLWHYARCLLAASVCAELLGRPALAEECLARAEKTVAESEYGKEAAKPIRPRAGVTLLWFLAEWKTLTAEEKERRALEYLEQDASRAEAVTAMLRDDFAWVLENRPAQRDSVRLLYPERLRNELEAWLATKTTPTSQ